MSDAHWERIKRVVNEALERDPTERAQFLDEACSGHPGLRREVESLLAFEGDDPFGVPTHATMESTHARPNDPRAGTTLERGTRLGPYEILGPIGAGGMGEVYEAKDTRLDRTVAVKVLAARLGTNEEQKRRFDREAKAISQLNHPNICTLHDVGYEGGVDYLVMEYIDGETLSAELSRGPLSIERTLELAVQIASGLERAHAAAIVHRDLKPGNIMLTDTGVKLLDFGLAKLRNASVETELVADGRPGSTVDTEIQVTKQGMVLGTVPYMSPEQATGRSVNEFSDQFSLGVVLYEMLASERPFQGEAASTILEAIVNGSPRSLRELRPEIPSDLEALVMRCLEKRPEERYPSVTALQEELDQCREKFFATRGVTIGWRAVALSAVVLAASAWLWLRADIVKWSERDSLAEIERLTESGELYEAFRIAHELQRKLPNDEDIQTMLNRITIPISIVTDPPGASVELAAYAGTESTRLHLGETPLDSVRVPYALAHWRISKDGFVTFEGAPFGGRPLFAFASGFELTPEGSEPTGMVRVPGGPYQRLSFPPVELETYWLDRFEVTNREFKAFVDAGGYDNEAYWLETFEDDGRVVSRDDAKARFVDTTGRAAPSGWKLGKYGDGADDVPVGGVSWYEASAYCRFAGKTLPGLFHWSAATAQDQLSDIIRVSNFDGSGPAAVGEYRGLGDFGTYDMAGNVREWVWNQGEGGHYILGGAWNDPTSRFRVDTETMPPFSREPTHGFRCALHEDPVDPALLARVTPTYFDELPDPVPDEIFEIYRGLYAYDRTNLEASIDSVDESSPDWRQETVSFRAGYGGERVVAHLFLPRNAPPPYQPVVWFPGNDVFFLTDSRALASEYLFDFLPKRGRALVYPVYKGTYERHVPFTFAPNETRDFIVMWSKDLARTLDYLEERPDIDAENAAYYGFSAGALYGPIFTAVDERFRASILLGGGLVTDFLPEVNVVNFARRSRVPTLMINGRDDFLNPYEILQKPFFDLLATPADQKRLARLEGGHIPPDRGAIIAEVEAWLDRHLGPVSAAHDGS